MSAFYSFAVFERALARPFQYGQGSISSRRGLLLRRHDDSGQCVCSEASPLPGHSPDRLEEVLQAIEHLSSAQLEEFMVSPGQANALPASLSFALAGIAAQKDLGPFRAVRSNALLAWRGGEETRAQFLKLQEESFKVFKLKVMEENAPFVPEFLKNLPSGEWKIRLDGNRSLSPATVAKLFQALQHGDLASRIDYFEEPLTQGWQHPLLRESPVSLAADESATSAEDIFALLEHPNSPDVFVLKPTVLGGLASLSKITAQLEKAGRRSVITSTLESEPGRRAIISYLGREGSREIHGLATGFLFRENYLADRAEFSEVPAASAEEKSFLQRLDWRGCP